MSFANLYKMPNKGLFKYIFNSIFYKTKKRRRSVVITERTITRCLKQVYRTLQHVFEKHKKEVLCCLGKKGGE